LLEISDSKRINASKGLVKQKITGTLDTNRQCTGDLSAPTFTSRKLETLADLKAGEMKLSNKPFQSIRKLMDWS
jgi:hypothetical protein